MNKKNLKDNFSSRSCCSRVVSASLLLFVHSLRPDYNLDMDRRLDLALRERRRVPVVPAPAPRPLPPPPRGLLGGVGRAGAGRARAPTAFELEAGEEALVGG